MKKQNLKLLPLIIATLSLSAFLTGCNTMEGAGKDIQGDGKALEKSAEKNK